MSATTTLPCLSRFAPFDPFEGKPDLMKKVLQAMASRKGGPVKLTSEEADYLITEGGGPDPDYTVPQQMFTFTHHGRLQALVVRQQDDALPPRCWRL